MDDSMEPLDRETEGAPLDELRPTLDRATATLKSALDEACRADLERVDTGELIRVEEVLAIANEAAKQAISVRRRLRGNRHTRSASVPIAGPRASRTIRDDQGREWTVFEVHPSSRAGRPVVREAYAEGWLSFDCGTETRRLAPIPDDWQHLLDVDLLALCATAEVSTRRRHSPGKGTAGGEAASQ